MLVLGCNRRFILFIFVLSCAAVLIFSNVAQRPFRTSYDAVEFEDIRVDSWTDGRQRQKHLRTHVAFASLFPAHFDVYLAAAGTFRDVLGDQGSVDVFAGERPFRFKFQEVIDRVDLYSGEVRDAGDLLHAMNDTDFYPAEPGALIDLLVLGTCEIDMKPWSDKLLEIWDSRPADKKFKLVCIVHNFRDNGWQRHITPWATRGAIRLLPIASHVGRTFRNNFRQLADNPEPDLLYAMYEYVQIDVHAPVLDLPDYGPRSTRDQITRAVVQGGFDPGRRDYTHIFKDLSDALKADPGAWGYLPLGQGREEYTPLPQTDEENYEEPFTLHLAGNGNLDVPRELKQVLRFHVNLDYPEFYAVMQSMDVVIPAFVNFDYFDFQASSTVAMAVECDIPLITTVRMRKAYEYIDDERVTITRPQALRDIPAIAAFRAGMYSPTNDSATHLLEFTDDVDKMLSRGWKKTYNEVRAFKERLWAENRKSASRILNDLPGSI
ncbi:hypothetical protein SCHPADRAFT_921523 [Schizopora paradoxa]|uniref:Glycosyltransferase family 1 protein n=1 Tax=Schizopora paradoxa TaxID=27342 RepID=A0A0H2RRB1_9AGAM|nr:hypothetical protein SCHPADRAFT_921523 [Schizopora paradoxa]